MLQLPSNLPRLLLCLLGLLVLKVVVVTLLSYRDYLPPNFESDFLSGRDGYFFGTYRWAFYPHIASGPLSLVLGLLLSSEALRRRAPRWHRILGRVQVVCVLFFVVPSGFVMAYRAEGGLVALLGFASLAIVTGATVVLGLRRALQRRYAAHQAWMQRCLCCLGSAVVIRISGGITTLAELDTAWIYPTMAWLSWLGPLAVLEMVRVARDRDHERAPQPSTVRNHA
jgi:hypothetical protein